ASIREREPTSNLGLYLRAGSMYSFTGFDVTQCNQNFRLSHSSLLIRFSDATTCATTLAELTEPSSPIPKECFRFRNHSEMLGLANTNTQLPGKSEDSEVLETKGYLLIILFPTISPLPEMGSSSVLENRGEGSERESGGQERDVHFVAMHAVTGSYARPNFVDYLGAKPDSISSGVPLEDFGHGHPDPNLTYATGLMSCIVAMDLISELQVMVCL
ncbi:unnamed protein product, partial [Brassica napus]